MGIEIVIAYVAFVIWGHRRFRLRHWFAAAIVLPPLTLALLLVAPWFFAEPFRQHVIATSFDQELWRRARYPDLQGGIRLRMLNDLVDEHLVKRPSRDRVLGLLGTPDVTWDQSVGYDVADGFMETKTVMFDFDERGRYARYWFSGH